MKKIILSTIVGLAFIPSVFAQYYTTNYSNYPTYGNTGSNVSFTYTRGCDTYSYNSYTRLTVIIGSSCSNSGYNYSNYNYSYGYNNSGYVYPTYSYQYVQPTYNNYNYGYNYGYNNGYNYGYNNYNYGYTPTYNFGYYTTVVQPTNGYRYVNGTWVQSNNNFYTGTGQIGSACYYLSGNRVCQ